MPVVALLGASTASASTLLRVDGVHGHDTGNCQAAPCRTIQYAVLQGRPAPDLITIQVAHGTYTQDVALGAADSGLTITGAGSGAGPAKNTIIKGVNGNATFDTTTAGDSTSLSLAHLRIVNPAGDSNAALLAASTSLSLNDVPIVAKGIGAGLVDSNAEATLLNSPITLEGTGGGAYAVSAGGVSLRIVGSPLEVKGSGGGVTDGGAPVTLMNSPIKLDNTSGSGLGVANGGAAVSVTGSPIHVAGTGSGIQNGGDVVTVRNSPVTLSNAANTGFAVANGGAAVIVDHSALVNHGTGGGIVNGGGAVTVTNSPITLTNSAAIGYIVANGGAAVTVDHSALVNHGTGGGIANGAGPVTVTNSPITLTNATGSQFDVTNGGAPVTVDHSALANHGTGGGVANGGAPVTLKNSPVTLTNTAGSGFAVSNGGGAVSVDHSPLVTHGTSSGGVANGGAPITVNSSSIKVLNPTGSGTAISNGGAAVAVTGSPIVVAGTGLGIANGGGPITVTKSPITLTNTSSTVPAIGNGGDVTVQHSNIHVKGKGEAVATGGGATTLSNLRVTLDNAASTTPALALAGRGSSLSHVTIRGAWKGPAISNVGSLSITDSRLSGGLSPAGPLVNVGDGAALGRAVSIQRSRLTQRSPTKPVLAAGNANVAVSSSQLLGGNNGVSFAVSGGVTRTLTIVSSTIDAGALGIRNLVPIRSVAATSDNTAGSFALVNIEGSILIERPAATLAGASGAAEVDCLRTEVPSTTQTATSTLGTISCPNGTRGNTSTASLGTIFSSPITNYRLNPAWSGVDSVPASAISLPFPFTDSATDLLGNPRVLNGHGTCLPGLRDKGAIELTGHKGVVPRPVISGPSSVFTGVTASFTGKAPNLHPPVHPTFHWHTSDGATGAGSHFSHKWAHGGHRTVLLTVRGAAGCVATTSKQLTVRSRRAHAARGLPG
ncbi:MAG: beta strand repeat-containing protein [Solirubrobacteraceae bacterium]